MLHQFEQKVSTAWIWWPALHDCHPPPFFFVVRLLLSIYFAEADASNDKIYQDLCSPLVHKVVGGFNATLVSYGADKTGKKTCLFGSNEV